MQPPRATAWLRVKKKKGKSEDYLATFHCTDDTFVLTNPSGPSEATAVTYAHPKKKRKKNERKKEIAHNSSFSS